MVRWREVTSLKIKALTSYSATLFDLKNKKCILTRPLHTVPTVESLHISYRTELPKILHVRISVTSLKKWGLHLLA